jgi:hypothetical protein
LRRALQRERKSNRCAEIDVREQKGFDFRKGLGSFGRFKLLDRCACSSPTPLCPAGHLPLKGEICSFAAVDIYLTVEIGESQAAGEMSGRTEGGRHRRELVIGEGVSHELG